jgi:hypothetical protein
MLGDALGVGVDVVAGVDREADEVDARVSDCRSRSTWLSGQPAPRYSRSPSRSTTSSCQHFS